MTTVNYRLPTSSVVVTGTVSRSRDLLGERHSHGVSQQPATIKDFDVAVLTEGGSCRYAVDVEQGWWLWSYKGSFSTTVDGRLCSVSVESTGTLNTVLTASAGVAGSLLVLSSLSTDEQSDKDLVSLAAFLGASERERAAFAEENGLEHDRAARLLTALVDVRAKIVEALEEGIASADAEYPAKLMAIERTVEAGLTRIKAHYTAWRATKVISVEEPFELRVPVGLLAAELPPREAVKLRAGPPEDLADLWQRFSIGITGTWLAPAERSTDAIDKVTPPRGEPSRHVVVRHPDHLELVVSEHTPGSEDRPEDALDVVISRSRHWVADGRSRHESFELKKSLWGRRALSLDFDADGFLCKVAAEGDAALPVALSALAGLPGDLAGGLESGTKVRTSLAAARSAGLDAQLSRVKKEVELRQQQLAAAGLTATDAETAQLGRLTSLQKILEAQTAIGEVDPRLVEAFAAATGDDLAWYQRPQPAGPPQPQVIRVITEGLAAGAATAGRGTDRPAVDDPPSGGRDAHPVPLDGAGGQT